MKIDRRTYADHYGPTTGDRVRLADTELIVQIERDATVYGDEAKFGGGKVIRDGMGQSPNASRERGSPDLVITRSGDPDARLAVVDCPIPSRMTLPPPNFASSPYVVASLSIWMTRSVSARRMRSPVVGP